MTRITSQKLRKMILATEDPLLPGERPEFLALFKDDGTPLDLSRDNTRMLWRGEWQSDETYKLNDVVIDQGDLFILTQPSLGPGGTSPYEENIDPNSIVHTRAAHAYAFGNYDFDDVPILARDVPFTDMDSAPVGNIFIGGGSRMLAIDVEPYSDVTVTTVGGTIVGYRDTGAPGAGNSVIDGNTPHASPWNFRVPEGISRVTIEVGGGVTSVTASGLSVSYDHTGAVESPMGPIAFPLDNGSLLYPGVLGPAYFFFDLATGGTVTITDPTTYNEFTKLYNSTGEFIAQNFSGSGTFGSVLVVHDLPPGRYFLHDQEAIANNPDDFTPTVTLSDGATFVAIATGIKYWDVLFRASSGPEGPQGPKGDKGDAGDDGPVGPPGAATSFLDAFAGDWAEGDYSAGKVVRKANGLYMAAVDVNALSEPGVSANWKLLVQGV